MERVEQELAELDQESLEKLLQGLEVPQQDLVQLAEETVRQPKLLERLREAPLQPKKHEQEPKRPPRRRREERRRQNVRLFDPLENEDRGRKRVWDFEARTGIPVIEGKTNWERELSVLGDRVVDEGTEIKSGRRTLFIRETRNLGGQNKTEEIMKEIRERVRTSYYMRYSFQFTIVNVRNGEVMNWWSPPRGSPWIKSHEEGRKWLNEREEDRLSREKTKVASSNWKYKETWNVDVKVVKDKQPLLGRGELPDWLKERAQAGRTIAALDGYEDNLCLWRCLAVHQGAKPKRSTEVARILAQWYHKYESRPKDVGKTSLDELEKVEQFMNAGKPMKDWLGIRVYEPQITPEGEVEWNLWASPNPRLKNVMTIGVWEGHAFLIKDMEKLAKIYVCRHCVQRFTKACHLQRHQQTCSAGETKVYCPAEKVRAPETAYEKAMYQRGEASIQAILWIESEAKKRQTHIHHAMCGHGGERWLPSDEKNKAPVDGYAPKTREVFQYHGCVYHGCPKCFPNRKEKPLNEKTCEEMYQATKERTEYLRKEGYKVTEAWTCEVGQQKGERPKKKTKTYPHAIIYDFEAYGDKTRRKEPTEALTIESAHVPISVSVGDTLEREPTHICEKDPKRLVERFMEELGRRAKRIREEVRAEHVPEDINLLPKDQRQKINDWCNQVPILGFNSGSYDMNLIKKHFVTEVAGGEKKVKVAKKGNKTMFLLTAGARFLDIINYLGPGTSYAKWVKAYGSETEKSWLPYEWLDTPERLEYRGLPEYEAWYSKLRKGYVLTRKEWEECQQKFKEKGMETLADWLRYYNNLDVGPGLEAFEKMRNFYTEKGIDIMKDAVSIPGVSLHYLLRGS